MRLRSNSAKCGRAWSKIAGSGFATPTTSLSTMHAHRHVRDRARPGTISRASTASICPLAFDTTPIGTPAAASRSSARPRLGDRPPPQRCVAGHAEQFGRFDHVAPRRTPTDAHVRHVVDDPVGLDRAGASTSPPSPRSARDGGRRSTDRRRSRRAAARAPSDRAGRAPRPRRTGGHRIDGSWPRSAEVLVQEPDRLRPDAGVRLVVTRTERVVRRHERVPRARVHRDASRPCRAPSASTRVPAPPSGPKKSSCSAMWPWIAAVIFE